MTHWHIYKWHSRIDWKNPNQQRPLVREVFVWCIVILGFKIRVVSEKHIADHIGEFPLTKLEDIITDYWSERHAIKLGRWAGE